MAESVGRLGEAELWRCVETTVREVLLPALATDAAWARAAAVQLAGLARYAQRRPGPEIEAERRSEQLELLRALALNRYVAARWDGTDDPAALDSALAGMLCDALGRADDDARAIHLRLRPLLIRQLDEELLVTGPPVAAFRGQLDA